MNVDDVKSFYVYVATNEYLWVIQVFTIVFATLVLNFFARRVVKRATIRVTQTKTIWDDAFVHAIGKPLTVLIWVIGLSWAAQLTYHITKTPILSQIPDIRGIGIIVIITWLLVRFVKFSEANLMNPEYCKKPMDQTTVSAFGKLTRASIFITSGLVIMQYMGYSVSGLLAFGGIGGIAVGFAAKDLLANFFGGLMIYLDRPFAVGDWIRSPDKSIEGTVEEIGWRLTRIRTFDKRPLYVPNSIFAQIAIENPSRMSNRRIYETIGIRYDDATKMDAIVNDVKQMLLADPEIDTTQTLMVNFNAFADSSMNFFVYTFTKTTDWVTFHAIKQNVLLKIHDIIASHNAEIAFPTSTLHINEAEDTLLSEEY